MGFLNGIRRRNLFPPRRTGVHGEENATAIGGLPKASALTTFRVYDGTHLFILLSYQVEIPLGLCPLLAALPQMDFNLNQYALPQ